MSSVEEHYQNLLAAHYTWMSGGFEQKLAENRQFFVSLPIAAKPPRKALDLGCGSGFQTLALAALEFEVIAIDSSPQLIDELRARTASLNVVPIVGDLRDSRLFAKQGPYDVVVCMGDTIVHLPAFDDVTTCLKNAHQNMHSGGTLVLSFRDLSSELQGIDRAIPVKLDDDKLMSTFLEYEPDHVVVNDMIFVRSSGNWAMHKSSYRKLRLATDRVVKLLDQIGFHSVQTSANRGFATIVATA